MVVTALISGLLSAGIGSAQAADSTLILSGGNGVFGLAPIIINGTASSVGAVKYFAGGVAIVGCEAVATTAVTPFIAKCAWTPAASGPVVLTGVFTPTDTVLKTANSNPLAVKVGLPVQGNESPIVIYADTVLSSGMTGALAPKFGTGCAITSQYMVGQTIVFRIYANNADLGGAPMDSSNTEKAYIEVAGVKEPIMLKYGNHSGTAFWTAILKTGASPLYNTLGIIHYSVTIVGKSTSKVKTLATKRVAVKDAAGAITYQYVSYYRTRTLRNPIAGAINTFTPSWAAEASMLTLYAVPTA